MSATNLCDNKLSRRFPHVINQRSRRDADSRRSLYSWNKTSRDECVQREFKINYVQFIFK